MEAYLLSLVGDWLTLVIPRETLDLTICITNEDNDPPQSVLCLSTLCTTSLPSLRDRRHSQLWRIHGHFLYYQLQANHTFLIRATMLSISENIMINAIFISYPICTLYLLLCCHHLYMIMIIVAIILGLDW